MKSLEMLVSAFSLAAMLAACGDGLVVSFEGVEWAVTPTRTESLGFLTVGSNVGLLLIIGTNLDTCTNVQ